MSDILETLDRLAGAPNWAPRVLVSREVAAEAAAEIRRLLDKAAPFDLVDHLNQPSRSNALAAAAAVQIRKGTCAAP